MIFTYIIIAITVLVSLAAFRNVHLLNKLILWPKEMHDAPQEYYRLLTAGFIHNDWQHLLFNMYSFYCFGEIAEAFGGIQFVVMYLTGIIFSSLPSFAKNKDNYYYRSLGASGGVATIMFFFIYHFPWADIRTLFIPISIPAILFGALYLAFEAYMDRKGGTNYAHDAHFWGSVYGLVFAFITDPTHGAGFMAELMSRFR